MSEIIQGILPKTDAVDILVGLFLLFRLLSFVAGACTRNYAFL